MSSIRLSIWESPSGVSASPRKMSVTTLASPESPKNSPSSSKASATGPPSGRVALVSGGGARRCSGGQHNSDEEEDKECYIWSSRDQPAQPTQYLTMAYPYILESRVRRHPSFEAPTVHFIADTTLPVLCATHSALVVERLLTRGNFLRCKQLTPPRKLVTPKVQQCRTLTATDIDPADSHTVRPFIAQQHQRQSEDGSQFHSHRDRTVRSRL